MKNKETIEDYDLIGSAIEGDTHAFRQLVDKHKDVSLSLAHAILKNKNLAEDTLQEVFIKVFRKLHTFNYKSSFATWLYRIVVNTSYTILKKQKRNSSLNLEDYENVSIPSEDTDYMKQEDQKRFIQKAFTRLKPDEALVLRLFYLCELSIREIEDITKFKKSKVKVCLHRGRDNLNFQLKQLLGDDIKYLL